MRKQHVIPTFWHVSISHDGFSRFRLLLTNRNLFRLKFPRGNFTLRKSVATKTCFPVDNSHLPVGKMGSVAVPILGGIKRICNGQHLTSLVSCALEAELRIPFTDKRAMRGTHSVGQKKQQKAKKGSDADSDVSSEGDGYMDSQEEDHITDSFATLDGEIF